MIEQQRVLTNKSREGIVEKTEEEKEADSLFDDESTTVHKVQELLDNYEYDVEVLFSSVAPSLTSPASSIHMTSDCRR